MHAHTELPGGIGTPFTSYKSLVGVHQGAKGSVLPHITAKGTITPSTQGPALGHQLQPIPPEPEPGHFPQGHLVGSCT